MKKHLSGRRDFLKTAGAGFGALIGTSVFGARGWLRPGPIYAEDARNAVTLRTHEWYGDIDETIIFPTDWDVHVQHMKGNSSPVLLKEDIIERIRKPIGTKTLAELAAGKKKVVVTFDDLTRPTPTYAAAGIIVDELRAAGVPEDGIMFLTSFGSHEHMNQVEAAAKLGQDVVRKYPFLNHNIYEHNVDVGTTTFGNRIELNPNFKAADLRVTISGIMWHGSAGYGGGGKAVLPGVVSLETIAYNHVTLGADDNTKGPAKIYTNNVRKDMEEAARFANVDFTVQIVYNGKREPVAVYAGDVIDAYREACAYAVRHYATDTLEKPDVCIINSYPQCRKAGNGLSFARQSLVEGGTVVLVIQNPMGMLAFHGQSEHARTTYQPYWERLPRADRSVVQQAGKIIVFSQYLQKTDLNTFAQKDLVPAYSWDEVMQHLKKDHRSGARVAVYPYSTIQHEHLELDAPGRG